MAYSYTEDTMENLKAYIVSNLQTFLTQITAEKADSVPLPMIEEHNIDTGYMDLDNQKKWPYISIVPMGDEWTILTADQDTLECVLQVTFVIGGYREAFLAAQILRYAAAFRNMLNADYRLGDSRLNQMVSPEMTVVYFQEVQSQADLKASRVTMTIKKDIS